MTSQIVRKYSNEAIQIFDFADKSAFQLSFQGPIPAPSRDVRNGLKSYIENLALNSPHSYRQKRQSKHFHFKTSYIEYPEITQSNSILSHPTHSNKLS